jgi:signal transduction histidine kinase
VKNITFKARSLALVLIVLPALFFLLFLSARGTTKKIYSISEDENFRRISSILQWEMEDEIEFASMLLKKTVADKKVKDMILKKDREGLLEYLLPEYGFYKEKFYRYHIHTAEGISLLRIHNPELKGDDLTKIRPMISEMIEQKRELLGIEKGREGFSMRVMLPVFNEGSYIGSIEYGMDFLSFLTKITNRYCGEFYIFELEENNSFSLFSSFKETPRYLPGLDEIIKIKEGAPFWLAPPQKDYSIGLIPFKDFTGNVAGFFQVELSRSTITEEISEMLQLFMTLMFISTCIIVSLLFLYIHQFLVNPMRNVVEQTKNISAEIISGNFNFRGDVNETSADFKEIINAVNSIIANLREREILLKAIIDGFPGIVFFLDRDFRVLWANARATTAGQGEIIGTRLTKALSVKGFFDGENALLEQTIAEKKISSKNNCYIRENEGVTRRECWEHISIPLFDEEERIQNILRISTDVTEKFEAELELKKLNETLEKKVDQEIQRRKEQEEKAYNQSRLASLGELAAGIAHEINQPLNSISFAIENIYKRFLNNFIDTDYFKKKIKDISGDIARTRRIIEHVRLFARESTGEYNISFSVNQCVQNAMSMIGVQIATHGIDITLQLDENIPNICGNSFQYEQVALNLLTNAKDALEERSKQDSDTGIVDSLPLRLVITTRRNNDTIILEVIDNGSGVAKNNVHRIFDPFFTTKPPGKGTGLGLSISYGIIQEFGGTIEVIPQEKGTLVRVSVPLGDTPCTH